MHDIDILPFPCVPWWLHVKEPLNAYTLPLSTLAVLV